MNRARPMAARLIIGERLVIKLYTVVMRFWILYGKGGI